MADIHWDKEMVDALNEIMNIAVGSASEVLSSLVGEEVILQVPKTEFCSFHDVYDKIRKVEDDSLVAIREGFQGSFSGQAYLIFPEKKSMDLASAVLGMQKIEGDISEVAREALMEIGNIILNSCLGTVCNLLSFEIEGEIPTLEIWSSGQDDGFNRTGAFVHIIFQMQERGSTGYLVIFMGQDSLNCLQSGIAALMASYG